MDEYAMAKFHTACPLRPEEQQLIIEKYQQINDPDGKRKLAYEETKLWVRSENAFQFACADFWTIRLKDVYTGEDRYSRRQKQFFVPDYICPLILKFCSSWSGIPNVYQPDIHRFSNIRHIGIDDCESDEIALIFKFAENCRHLKRISCQRIYRGRYFFPRLTQFLEYKVSKNEQVILSFRHCTSNINVEEWLNSLGEAINGISGFDVFSENDYPGHTGWLNTFSKVRHIESLSLHGIYNASTCLSDIIRYAPEGNGDFALSTLCINEVPIRINRLSCFKHWRFSRLKICVFSGATFGYEGAELLAKHATFWPFVEKFQLMECAIPSGGFKLLFPAMLQGNGCKNLLSLNLSKNYLDHSSFEDLGLFFSSPNLAKLDFVHLTDTFQRAYDIPSTFLDGLKSVSLLDFRMNCTRTCQQTSLRILHSLLYDTLLKILNIEWAGHRLKADKIKRFHYTFHSKSPNSWTI